MKAMKIMKPKNISIASIEVVLSWFGSNKPPFENNRPKLASGLFEP
jgi:hypothetical protein